MQVIAGKAKGRALIAPKGFQTRPITARIKEALFNIWQTRIVGANFLDLFAGSGSIGIEAISRGAEKVVFVERSRKAIEVIKKNLATCNFTDGYEIQQGDVFKKMMWMSEAGSLFDLIYLDPPFTVRDMFLPVLEALSQAAILAHNGAVAIRAPREMELPEQIGELKRIKLKQYGISNVHFFGSAEEMA